MSVSFYLSEWLTYPHITHLFEHLNFNFSHINRCLKASRKDRDRNLHSFRRITEEISRKFWTLYSGTEIGLCWCRLEPVEWIPFMRSTKYVRAHTAVFYDHTMCKVSHRIKLLYFFQLHVVTKWLAADMDFCVVMWPSCRAMLSDNLTMSSPNRRQHSALRLSQSRDLYSMRLPSPSSMIYISVASAIYRWIFHLFFKGFCYAHLEPIWRMFFLYFCSIWNWKTKKSTKFHITALSICFRESLREWITQSKDCSIIHRIIWKFWWTAR